MTKVVLLGLDGATFEMLNPMMDTGRLPVLSHLLRGGAHGVLESTIPPVTFPAWPTMYTGRNPGAHGLTSFRRFEAANLGYRTARLGDVACARLWTVLNQEGVRTGIFNVPATYPAEPVEGFMVSGFVTPPEAPEAVQPTVVREAFLRAFPDYDCNARPVQVSAFDDRANRQRLLEELRQTLLVRSRALEWLLERWPVDFLWVVLETIDRVNHYGYAFLSPESALYETDEGKEVRRWTLDLLAEQDRVIERLLERMKADAVIVVSDHGFAWTPRQFWLQQYLIEKHLMVPQGGLDAGVRWCREALETRTGEVRKMLGPRLRRLARRMRAVLARCRGADSPGDMWGVDRIATWDWRRSKTWIGPFAEWGVRINASASHKRGIVGPDEYDTVVAQVIEALRAASDPETGRLVFDRVERRDVLYQGPYSDRAPDVLFLTQRNVTHRNTPLASGVLPQNYVSPVEKLHAQNTHDRYGIFGATGTMFQPVEVSRAGILDVFPTVMYARGLPVPDDLEGRVLQEAFTEEHRSAHPLRRGEASAPAEVEDSAAHYSAEDEAAISKRLEDLGYL